MTDLFSEPSEALLWAVFVALDSPVEAPEGQGVGNAEAWLQTWRDRAVTDQEIVAELPRVFQNNRREQKPDEPRLVIAPTIQTVLSKAGAGKAAAGRNKRKLSGPALWLSWTHNAPDLERPREPDVVGEEFAPLIRRLMAGPLPPPAPTGADADGGRWR